MTLEKAIELLKAEYERAKDLEYVRKPLAWALFKVWRKADTGVAEDKREYNRIAQQKSRAKRKALKGGGMMEKRKYYRKCGNCGERHEQS
jgi:hypothetical protein